MNRIPLLIGLGLVLACSSSRAQTKLSPLDQMLWTRPRQVTDWAWINQPWKGNSKPYLRINRQINAAFANPKRIEAVTQKYRAAAAAKPTDPLAVYAWGYAAYVARPFGSLNLGRENKTIALALSLPKSPATYEYARLRFMVTADWLPYLQLKPLGNRLLQRNPNDLRVKQGLIDILAVGSPEERQRALSYAQLLVHNHPNSASSYAELGWVYDLQFGSRKKTSDGDKAISAYKKAMTFPATPGGRQRLLENIHRIQHAQEALRTG